MSKVTRLISEIRLGLLGLYILGIIILLGVFPRPWVAGIIIVVSAFFTILFIVCEREREIWKFSKLFDSGNYLPISITCYYRDSAPGKTFAGGSIRLSRQTKPSIVINCLFKTRGAFDQAVEISQQGDGKPNMVNVHEVGWRRPGHRRHRLGTIQ